MRVDPVAVPSNPSVGPGMLDAGTPGSRSCEEARIVLAEWWRLVIIDMVVRRLGEDANDINEV